MGKARKRKDLWQLDDFRVAPGTRPHLGRRPTAIEPLYHDEKDARRRLEDQVDRTAELQDVLYASDHHSLLLIFQAMDAAGKDGAIKHVMRGVNPLGCQVSSFKQPSAGGAGSRLPVAHDAAAAGARPDRHLQSLVLRGSAGGARASGVPRSPAPAATAWSRSRPPLLGAALCTRSAITRRTCIATAPQW